MPSFWVGAMPRGTGRGSLEPFCPQGLPAEAGGARGQHPGRGARNAPAGQTCLGGQGKGAPHGKGCLLDPGGVLLAQPASALLSFSPHVFPAGTPKAAGAASSSASSPPCPCSSARDSPSWLQGEPSSCQWVSRQHPARVPRWRGCSPCWTGLIQGPSPHCCPFPFAATASVGSELPAHTIYRPWFSPYSYFIRSAAAPQQHLSSSLATGTQEPEEADRLSETICSSSCSSEDPQPSQRGRQNSGRVSITVRDILAAARGQPVPQQGYKCRACCRVFPTLWAVKTHIQHSSQEGYSCKAYYRKLKVLLEKESQEQEGPPAPQ